MALPSHRIAALTVWLWLLACTTLLPLHALANPAQHNAARAQSAAHPRIDARLFADIGLPLSVAVSNAAGLGRMLRHDAEGNTRVTLRLQPGAPASMLATLAAHGFKPVSVHLRQGLVEGWMPPTRILELESVPSVYFVGPSDVMQPRVGSVGSQGVSLLHADTLQAMDATGGGVTVGVISIGDNAYTLSQNSGDLPGTITNLPAAFNCTREYGASNCSEGTAMMEIVHDMAPAAGLAFCPADSSTQLLDCINTLATGYGAKVIVDDLGSPTEPMFEDGPVATTVNTVVSSQSVLYATAAGNSHGCFYEANYTPLANTGAGSVYDSYHDFGAAAGVASSPDDTVQLSANGEIQVTLQWNDPFNSPTDDYDLFLENSAGKVLASSTNVQNGGNGQEALEQLDYVAGANPLAVQIVIAHKSGSSANNLKMLLSDGGSTCAGLTASAPIQFVTPSQGDIMGHAAAAGALTVGAIDASSSADPDTNLIEPYSSTGPVRIDFPQLVMRAKPDISGVDDVSISGAGNFVVGYGNCGSAACFSGTSAAAPHIAGILAILAANFHGNYEQALLGTATNSASLGLNQPAIFGAGLANAYAAAALLNQPPTASIITPSGSITVPAGTATPFQGSCNDPENLPPDSLSWSFGGGSGLANAAALNPGSRAFATPGAYQVSFSCADSFNVSSNTATVAVTVTPSVVATIATPAATLNLNQGQQGSFVGNCADTISASSTYSWNFGSGSGIAASTLLAPGAVTFPNAGSFIVTFTCKDSGGASSSASVTVNVSTTVLATITSPSGSVSVAAGAPLSFAGNCSDVLNPPPGYAWTFGNGSGVAPASTLNPGAETFSTPGNYSVSFVCTDSSGVSSTASVNVTVTPSIVAAITSPASSVTLQQGQQAGFDASCADTINPSPTYSWNFGNSGVAASTALNPGTVSFPNAGSFTVTFTCTDSGGSSKSASVTVNVSATVVAAITSPTGSLISLTAGQQASFAATCSDLLHPSPSYAWNFGSGSGASPATVLDPGPETFTTAGSYIVKFTCTDSSGLSGSADILVNVAAPTVAGSSGSSGGGSHGGAPDALLLLGLAGLLGLRARRQHRAG